MMLCELPPALVIDIDLSNAISVKISHLVLRGYLDLPLLRLSRSAKSKSIHHDDSGCFEVGS